MTHNNKFISIPVKLVYLACFAALLLNTGCKKYLDIDLPVNTIAGESAFTTDKSTAAVLNSAYAGLSGASTFDGAGIGYLSGLYTDELRSLTKAAAAANDQTFYTNSIQAVNAGAFWTTLYKYAYTANLVIEGAAASNTLSQKDQWMGEGYFLRAFLHFYLVNLYGDIPLALTSDYASNNVLKRTPVADVYKQIVKDLLLAQSLLSADYKGGDGLAPVNNNRARPNKATATALLARVYLYLGDYVNAETQANTILNNTAYKLAPLSGTFLAASPEIIWALAPPTTYVKDYIVFYASQPDLINKLPTGVNAAMSGSQDSAFETGDGRRANWTRALTDTASHPNVVYRMPYKYKSNTTGVEYIVLFRLAEQYLIRAEARTYQGKINGANSAESDVDSVRKRALLPATTATGKDPMLAAIAQERRVELFSEEGHRFFDLRRTGKLDNLMLTLTPQKGGPGWASFMQWWPIPANESFANPNIKQTPGYN